MGYAPCLCFFFFQAEDGIRDLTVTGVQTCALPIFHVHAVGEVRGDAAGGGMGVVEVSLFLEVAHRVANCGRGERVAELLRNSPAPRRLGGFHVGLDYSLPDLAVWPGHGTRPVHQTS